MADETKQTAEQLALAKEVAAGTREILTSIEKKPPEITLGQSELDHNVKERLNSKGRDWRDTDGIKADKEARIAKTMEENREKYAKQERDIKGPGE